MCSETEINELVPRLKEKRSDLADLFQVLLSTGLRIGEGLVISVDDFYVGEPEHETLKNGLARHGIESLGYLVIESQLGHKTKIRDKHKVMRKPLKGRKRIKTGEGRIIPIFDKDIFNILARQYNAQIKLMRANKYGTDGKDYLLFDGIRKNNLVRL